ncbi:MAG: glycosyltransferase family 4 protein [Alphaproteobacteria bacterium]
MSPTTTAPSGAATMARTLMAAMRMADHRVDLASRLTTSDDGTAPDRRRRLRAIGQRMAARVAARYRALPTADRPDVWVTYGGGGDAPDWLGPPISADLAIPYVAIEPKGAPSEDHDIDVADAAVALSDASLARIEPIPEQTTRRVRLLPFLDTAPIAGALRIRDNHRAAIASRLQLPRRSPWILFVCTMRHGDRLASYRALARAMSRLVTLDWRLIVVGAGPAAPEVEAAMRTLPLDRVRFVGAMTPNALRLYYVTVDLAVAPAVGGTCGMSLLEAQACGVPVVASDEPGVREVVRDGVSGKLTGAGNLEALANAIGFLLRHPQFRESFAKGARRAVMTDHDIGAAARLLDDVLTSVARPPG